MSTYTAAPRDLLSFGDICEAEFLYDVHARADARALTREEASAPFARKKWQIDEAVSYFVPLGPTDESYVLAHGRPRTALLLSDDCLIETALGRDGRDPSGRLLFAPVAPASQDTLDSLDELPTYGRFGLRSDEVHAEHAIVELRRCFMVDARDVAALADGFSVRSLTDETRDGLALRWAAYAIRRGKFVVEDNLEKFGELLLDAGIEQAAAERFAVAVAAAAAAAWRYEGSGIEEAGLAFDQGNPPFPVVERLEEQLQDLLKASTAALDEVVRMKAELR